MNQLIISADEVKKEKAVQEIMTSTASMQSVVETLTIKDPEFGIKATQAGIKITQGIKALKEKKTEYTKGAKQLIKDVDAVFNPQINYLENLRTSLNQVQERHRLMEEEKERKAREAEEKRLAKAQEKFEEKVEKAIEQGKAMPIMTAPVKREIVENKTIKTDAGKSIRVEHWTWELSDITELFKSNPDLVQMIPNKKVIDAMIKSGKRDIPGLIIKKEIRTSYRA